MPNILWKGLNLCFSKFKCFPTITFPQPSTIADEADQDHHLSTTTHPSPLVKNFNSLYDTFSSSTTTAAAAAEDFFSSSDYDSDEIESIPDFSSAFASHRFFFSSPGTSNSIFEPPEPAPPPQQDSAEVLSGGVAVHTYSPDPYSDFKKSMVEMIEARDVTGGKVDWEFLHELLLCYLTLNPKHTHKFIVGAFADIIVSLVWPPSLPDDPAGKSTSNDTVPRHDYQINST